MLALIEFDWGASDTLKKLSRDDYMALAEAVSQLNLSKWDDGKNEPPYNYLTGKFLVDLATDGPRLTRHGLKFTVANFKNTYKAAGRDPAGVEHHLHIAIPNIGLLAIDEVTWVEDACTQSLQRKLDDGWRILAVCPPNGQRRPDYILGRTKGGS